jgi:sugar phosphate isomerase/epimerase
MEEMIADVTRDIKHAARIGARCIRMLVVCTPELMEACAPIAGDHGVWLGIEVHAPWFIKHEWIQKHLEVAYKMGTDKLGIIPDMGIFVERFPRVVYERIIRNGAQERFVKMIVERYDNHDSIPALLDEVTKLGGNEHDIGLARTASHYVWSDPAGLADVAGAMRHIHGKFYEMTEECKEYSIPYDKIVPVLAKAGYDGYISAEYEGNRHIEDAYPVDSVEQVRRYQRMLANLIEQK